MTIAIFPDFSPQIKVQSGARGDSQAPCSICHDVFDQHRQQVLLSCSHTFHRACLEAFERFSSSTSCPMCRRKDYEKRLIFDGARSHRSIAATRIQAMWRGHLARRWYRQLLKNMSAPTEPVLRRRHFQRRLGSMADDLVASSREKSLKVDNLLSDVDSALEASRKVLASADVFLHSQKDVSASSDMWASVAVEAKKRGERDCPICMTSLTRSLPGDENGKVAAITVLLSCSHVFHKQCLVTMETFSCRTLPSCPVCRSAYIRQDWSVDSVGTT